MTDRPITRHQLAAVLYILLTYDKDDVVRNEVAAEMAQHFI